MKNNAYILALAALLAALPRDGYAYFEGMRPCTRAVGMAEAFTGVADDANAIFYNPAGLALLDKLQVPMNYTKLFGGLDLGGMYQTYFAVAGPVPGYEQYGSWGFSWYRRSADMVVNEDAAGRTTTFDLLDENMIHLSWGRHMPLSFTVPKWNRKINLKQLYGGVSVKIPFYRWGEDAALAGGANDYFDGDYGKAGFGLDAALLYDVEKFENMSVGLTIRDLLKTRMDLKDNGDVAYRSVESSVAFGWSYLMDQELFKGAVWRRFRIPAFSVHDLRLSADAVLSTRKMAYHHMLLGVEKWNRAYEQDFAFRSGMKVGARDYLFYALGGSYRYFLPKAYGGLPFKYGFQFDYAFSLPLTGVRGTYGDHSFTLTLLQGEKPDTEPPAVSVKGPARFTPDEDGKDDAAVFRLGATDESGIRSWTFTVARDGKTVRTYAGEGTPPATLRWDGRAADGGKILPNGTYTCVFSAIDNEENTGTAPKQTVQADAAPPVFTVTPAAPSFSPNGDRAADNLVLDLNVDKRIRPVMWEVVIASESDAGTPVRTLNGKGAPPRRTVWDGTDGNGTYVPAGVYLCRMNASDASGEAYRSPPAPVRVDLSGPEASLTVLPQVFSPDGDGVNDKTVFGIILRDPSGIGRWQLEVLAGDSGSAPVVFSGDTDAARTVTWDGTRKDGTVCEGGTWVCRLTAYDKLGNRTVDSSATVGIGNEDPAYRVFSPNKDGKFDQVTISLPPTSLAYDAATVIFYGPDKKEVGRRPLRNGETEMTWGGTVPDGSVLADGLYTYKTVFTAAGAQVDESRIKTLRIDTTPPDAAVFASPAAFSPVKNEKTTLTLQATDAGEIASWYLEVAPDGGKAFIPLRGEGKPPAKTEWNGTGEDGTAPENGGKFVVTMVATDIAGNTGTSPVRILTLFGKQKILPIDPVQFELGKAVIKKESYPVLAGAADILKEADRLPIAVYGHTDNQGDPARNLQLSQDRAQAVVDHFVTVHGIPRERFKEIKGFGDTKPVADNATREGRAQNRRTEIKLLEE